MKKILSLWSTPRSRSTAFMWMMKTRGDYVVLLEPFARSAYYSPERIFKDRVERPLLPENNYSVVLQNLIQQSQKVQLFVKDFPYYFLHIVDDRFLSLFQHTFLIRNPAQMLPSYFYKYPDLTFEETGYQQLARFFEKVVSFTGEIPPLIDADDLVQNPTSIIKIYCKKVGIPFLPQALNWETPDKKVKEMSSNDGSWLEAVSVSQGLNLQSNPSNPNYLSVNQNDRLKQLYDWCLPYYEKLSAYRLRSNL